MKKFIVALILAIGLGFIAYASMSRSSNKKAIEKKTEKQEVKKECSGKCRFS